MSITSLVIEGTSHMYGLSLHELKAFRSTESISAKQPSVKGIQVCLNECLLLDSFKNIFSTEPLDQYLINDNTKHSLAKDIQVCSNQMKDNSIYMKKIKIFFIFCLLFLLTPTYLQYI